MIKQLRRLARFFSRLDQPGDELENLRLRLLHHTINVILGYALALTIIQLVSQQIPPFVFILDAALIPFMLLTRYFYRKGNFNRAALYILLIGFLINTLVIYAMGSVYSPATPNYVILIIFAGLFFGRTGVLVTSGLSSLFVLVLLEIDLRTSLMKDILTMSTNPLPSFITYTMVFAVSGLIVDGTINNLVKTLARLRTETAEKQSLLESRRALLSAIEQSVQSVLLTDENGIITYINSRYAAVTGLQPEAVIGKRVTEFSGGLVPQDPSEQIWETVNNGEVYIGQMSSTDAHGHLRFFNVTVSPIYHINGNKAGFLSIAEDVTDTRKADNLQDVTFEIAAVAHSLSSMEEIFPVIHFQLQRVMDAKNFYISLYDPTTDLLSFPYLTDELDDSVPEPYHPTHGLTARVIQTGKSVLLVGEAIEDTENVIVIGDRPRSWLGVPLKVDDICIGMMAVQNYSDPFAYNDADLRVMEFVSITVASALNKIRVAAELAESNLRFTQVANNIAEAFWITAGEKEGMIYLNQAAEKVYGVPLAQLNADPECILAGMDVIAQNEYQRTMQQARRGFPATVSFKYQRPDGETRWISNNCTPVLDEQGRQVRITGYSRDITEEMEYQAMLRGLNEQLETRVSERTQELERNRDELRMANAELEKAGRLKDEFLASMSHELRTPLTGILGLAEALQYQTYGSLTEKQLYVLKNIELSGHHLLDLINDILDVSKIEADKLEINPVPCQVAELCQASLQLTKGMAHQKKINIEFTIKPANITLHADPRRVKQMLVNLLSNAIKFTPQEGKVGLDVTLNAEDGTVDLAVWDTGIGISAEDQTRLFRPFVQLDAALNRQQNGTGLGLVLVSHLAQLHGGSIDLQSEPGKGSRFTITLPWNEKESLPNDRVAPERSPALTLVPTQNPLRVVLVDDNTLILNTIGDHLRALGHSVLTYPSGVDALAALPSLDPQVLITDIQMPGLDGLELIHRVRAMPQAWAAKVPIIALTALAMPGDERRCKDAGANHYLAKPVSLSRITALLQSL